MDKTIVLTISYNYLTGNIQLNGPLEDKILCLGLLESAKDIVKDFNLKLAAKGD